MKSLLDKFKKKVYMFFSRELHNKIDKLLMLESQILSRENLKIFTQNRNWGGKIV